ncbi:hypothetical protein LCGC14_1890300 [marine sediment metagenome]|uniref:Uncharacterized protein n=1 Tax=marine sediment metagenome TaxID=412755 RepID=A0A0F9IXW3_9ZZZZ
MDTPERAEAVFQRSISEALGYIELAQHCHKRALDATAMRKAALRALQRFSDNDELIDAMYDADMRADMEADNY